MCDDREVTRIELRIPESLLCASGRRGKSLRILARHGILLRGDVDCTVGFQHPIPLRFSVLPRVVITFSLALLLAECLALSRCSVMLLARSRLFTFGNYRHDLVFAKRPCAGRE